MNIRQSTARTILVGPILDSTGAAKTDEVVASILISKEGAAPAALDVSATLTHQHTGYYSLAYTANDADTLGCAEISLNSGTNTMAVVRLNVLTAAAWDALHAESGGMIPAIVEDYAIGQNPAELMVWAAHEDSLSIISSTVWKLNGMLSAVSNRWQYTAEALALAPTPTITPLASTVSAGQVSDGKMTQYEGDAFGPVTMTVIDDTGAAVDLTAATLLFIVYRIGDPSSVVATLEGTDIGVSGTGHNVVTISSDETINAAPGMFRYVLKDTTADKVRARGVLTVEVEADEVVIAP